jgi:hypothetical protein
VTRNDDDHEAFAEEAYALHCKILELCGDYPLQVVCAAISGVLGHAAHELAEQIGAETVRFALLDNLRTTFEDLIPLDGVTKH